MGAKEHLLVDNGDGTIMDTGTGLIWQKADAGPMTWAEAEAACKNLSLAGASDWRLPTIEELKALFQSLSSDEHLVDRRVPPFEYTGDRYWTDHVVEPYYAAYLVNFNGGSQPWEAKNSRFHVRAVRSPSD